MSDTITADGLVAAMRRATSDDADVHRNELGHIVEKPERWSRSLQDLFQRPEKDAVVEGMFGAGDLGMVFGDSGSGKTFLIVDTLVRLAKGAPVFGCFPTARACKVLYLTEEGLSGLAKRFEEACALHGVTKSNEAGGNIFYREALPRLYRGHGALEEFRTGAKSEGIAWDVIVFDHLSDVAEGSDENANGDAQRVASGLTALARDLDCAVIVVHHSKKGEDEYRGASAYKAKMDFMAVVTGPENPRQVRCYKSKHYEPFKPLSFQILKGSFESAYIEWTGPAQAEAAPKDGIRRQIVEVLSRRADREGLAMSVTAIHHELHGTPAQATLRKHLHEMYRDATCAVAAISKETTGRDGKTNRAAWHYWIRREEGSADV